MGYNGCFWRILFANLYKYFFIPIQFYQVYDDGVKIRLLD